MNGQSKTIDAAKNVIDAIEHERDGNLDFAIWQAIRKLKDLWIRASQSGEIDWQGRETALAYAVSAVGTPEAAEIAIGIVRSSVTDSESLHQLLKAVADAGNELQLGSLLEAILAHPRDGTFDQSLAPLVARTQRDGVIPQNAGAHLAKAVANGNELLQHPSRAAAIVNAARVWKADQLDTIFAAILNDAPFGPTTEADRGNRLF